MRRYNRGMLMVEESHLPLTITVPGITDEQFQELCEKYDNFRVEYTAEGDLIVMPPTDPETSSQNLLIAAQLIYWALKTNRGLATESSGGFVLPNGARLSPDAAWISDERRRRKPTCPEFVIELLSPSDRPNKTRAKMREWIANGAELGWLINPRTRTVTIYRPGLEPEECVGVTEVAGEGPIEGFVLDLKLVWDLA